MDDCLPVADRTHSNVDIGHFSFSATVNRLKAIAYDSVIWHWYMTAGLPSSALTIRKPLKALLDLDSPVLVTKLAMHAAHMLQIVARKG